MRSLHVRCGKKPVYYVNYLGGSAALHRQISGIAEEYVSRLTAAYPRFKHYVTISYCYIVKPLRDVTPTTTGFGKLSSCHVPAEVRATVLAVQRDIARAIMHWEASSGRAVAAHPQPQSQPQPQPQQPPPPQPRVVPPPVPQRNDFEEIEHPNDSYWEEREHTFIEE